MLSYLPAVSEIKCVFIWETVAKMQLHLLPGVWGFASTPPVGLFAQPSTVLLMAPARKYRSQALKKKSAFLCLSSLSFTCVPPFPGGRAEGGVLAQRCWQGTDLLQNHAPSARLQKDVLIPQLRASQDMAVFQDTT